MSTMSDFVNSGASNQAQVDAMAKVLAYMPNRNRIINGKMEIAQRGTSFVGVSSLAYTLDSFIYGKSGGVASDIICATDAPAGFNKSLKLAITNADTTVGPTDYISLTHKIEGYNVSDFVGKPFVFSFWVKSSKTGIYSVSFRNSGSDASYSSEYVIYDANTWEFKTIKVLEGLPSFGTWDFNNGVGLRIGFILFSGSDAFATELNTWMPDGKSTSPNQVNFADTVGATFNITGLQLEAGELVTPFEHRPYGQELALCQRYFYRSPSNLTGSLNPSGVAGTSFPITFPVRMRVIPSITYSPILTDANYSTATLVAGKWAVSQAAIGTPTKTGVVSFSSVPTTDSVIVMLLVSTFNFPVNRLQVGPTGSLTDYIFDASAEL